MTTDLKLRPQWEEEDTAESQEGVQSIPMEAQFSRYNFLRNIWGTYFHDRQSCHS